MSVLQKIHEAKLAFASGKLSADPQGYLHVRDVGDIKLSVEFIASVGRSMPTCTAKQRWVSAINAATVACGGNRARAALMVAAQQPQLRTALVSQANKPTSKTAIKPRAYRRASEYLREQVELLVEQGIDRRKALAEVYKSNPGLQQSIVNEANKRRR